MLERQCRSDERESGTGEERNQGTNLGSTAGGGVIQDDNMRQRKAEKRLSSG